MAGVFRMWFSTMTWKSTSTLIPCASFICSLSVFCFRRSSIFFRRSSLFCFSLSISSRHEDFLFAALLLFRFAFALKLLVGWCCKLFVPSFRVWSTTGPVLTTAMPTARYELPVRYSFNSESIFTNHSVFWDGLCARREYQKLVVSFPWAR